MEIKSDLAIVLKTFPYQERDRVCVLLTEHSGKITALAKGAIHSRRFGGSLDTLACSRIRFVQKPNAEMGRIDEAVLHHEFGVLRKDFDRLSLASFGAEFCLRLIEPHAPARELFVAFSNFLFHLDSEANALLCTNAFLVKALNVMGYAPHLSSCVRCEKSGESFEQDDLFWSSESGGILCGSCAPTTSGKQKMFNSEAHFLFSACLAKPFKQLVAENNPTSLANQSLFNVLTDFMHHHIPNLPAGGLKSLGMVSVQLFDSQAGRL